VISQHPQKIKAEFFQLWAEVVMAAAMVLMGRRSGSYGCVIQNGKNWNQNSLKFKW
jgi:hypothetical protein